MTSDDDDHTDWMPDAERTPVPPVLAQRGWTTSPFVAAMVVAGCLGLCSVGLVFTFTKNTAVRNTNVGSRYGQVEGLVNHGTYAITKTRYVRTIDKVKWNGEFYSSKPPLLPTITAGLYWVYREATGYDIRTSERKVLTFTNLMMGAVLHLLLMVFWLRLLLLLTRRPEVVALGMAGLAFGYLGVGYAIELNNHSVAGTITLVGFYYAFRIRNDVDVRTRHFIISGVCMGLLPGIDLPSAYTSFATFVYLATKDWRRTLLFWVPAAVPFVGLALLLNYISTGDIRPVYLRGELYRYAGSYWDKPKGVDALKDPKWLYATHLLVGHHGLFSMSPLLVLSVVGWVKALRTKRMRAEVLYVGSVLLVLMIFYIFRTNNYGGNCVGFRWSIAFTPLLFVFYAVWLDEQKRLRIWHVMALCAATGVTMFYNWEILAFTPWKQSSWQSMLKVLLGEVKVP